MLFEKLKIQRRFLCSTLDNKYILDILKHSIIIL